MFGHWHLRVRSRLGSTGHTTCSSSCKAQHQLDTDAGLSRPVPGLISKPPAAVIGDLGAA
jgi:hypothetical protein